MGSCVRRVRRLRSGGPGPFVLITSMLVGVVGGAIWAGIAGVLRFWRNVPEVLTTLLLGVVAANLMGLGLRNRFLLLAPARGTRQPQPGQRAVAARHAHPARHVVRQRVPHQRLRRRRLGDHRVAGPRSHGGRVPAAHAGPQPPHGDARRCGREALRPGRDARVGRIRRPGRRHHAGRRRLRQLPTGRQLRRRHRLRRPAGGARRPPTSDRAIFVAFLFGGLRTGSGFLRSTGVSARIADVVQGMLVLAMLLPPAILYLRARRRALAATSART